MTREEAIRKLQKQKAEYLEEWVDYSGVAEAFDMAIEALSEPSGDLHTAYSLVFQDLQKCSMFTGLYDAKNGSSIFMNGISTVMESIAYGVSEEVGDAFTDLFIKNMVKCEEETSANAEDEAVREISKDCKPLFFGVDYGKLKNKGGDTE